MRSNDTERDLEASETVRVGSTILIRISAINNVADKKPESIICAKVLGVYISSDLSWRSHVDYVCPNASKSIYFLSKLKRAGASQRDLHMFYKAAVRSVVEYAAWCGTPA